MPASKAQQKAVSKYMKANYDEIKVRVEKGQKDSIQAHASARGESTNGFIGRAISETMTRDSGGTPPETAGKPAEAARRGGVVSVPSAAVRAAQGGQELAAQAAQEAAEAADMPFPVDKARAAESLFGILGNLGDVDIDESKGERLGLIHLPPDTLETAQEAAEAAGEDMPAFIRRAVNTQAWRDKEDRERAASSILPNIGEPVPPGQINQAIEKNIAYLCKKLNEGERRASSRGRSKESDFARCILRDLFEAKYSVEEVRTAVERAAQEGYTGSWLGLKDYCKKLFPQREKKKWEA